MGRSDPPARTEGTLHASQLPRLDESVVDDRTPAIAAKPVLDLSQFGQYVDLQPIGSGAVGQVFRAFDPKLKRYVALKFLWVESPEHAAKFQEEAQAQARIEHDSVCKVFEVGHADGRLFISMQYVNGRTLRELGPSMALADRVRAMKSVAEALHASHKLGMIHRDVKPTNIMIERSDEGAYKPYVMDFGLVRRVDSGTVGNEMVGTPQYMAPEQVRSLPADVRTDVYGLGATLYSALVDRPPFTGVTAPEVMLAVLRDEPVRLRRIVPSLPRDLETITMKCLEKDPARRYPTARALADDLGRYLAGDPIEAAPPSVGYRLWKRARKHRAAVVGTAFVLVAVGAAGGVALQARHAAAERARLAQVFGQTAQSVEAIARYAQLLPLHDTRRETAAARALLDGIEARRRELGTVAEGPAAYAVGRARLALGEPQAARVELEHAWAAGWRTPDVAGALGLALGELYERALDAAERIDNSELRQHARADATRELRDPALARLQAGAHAATLPAALVEGLIALHERRLDEAVAAARRAQVAVPWLFEAHRLEGDAESQRGLELGEHGQYDAALAAFDAAERAYHAGEEIARSDAASYLAECQLGRRRMHALALRGLSPEPAFAKMRPACASARIADPSHLDGDALVSHGWAELADWRVQQGQDPREAIAQAIATGEKVLASDPHDEVALGSIGWAYDDRADYEHDHGLDSHASIAAAVDSYERIVAANPSPANISTLAAMQVRNAEWQAEHGVDPAPTVRATTARLDQALVRAPGVFALPANYALLWKAHARYQVDHGEDPTAATATEMTYLERGLAINPSFQRFHRELGMAWAMRAQFAVEHGADAGDAIARGLAEEQVAEKAQPGSTALMNLALLERLRALATLQAGGDATPAIEAARRHVGAARKAGDNYLDDVTEAEVELAAYAAARAQHREGAAELARAAAAAARATAKSPTDQRAMLALAEVRIAEGGAAQRAAAGALIARVLSINPHHFRAESLQRRTGSTSAVAASSRPQ
jgi:eukaryotic-like serine/threonine-protein kinase